MKPALLAPLLERFFTERLMRQRQASSHTVASYRDTFRLLLQHAQRQLRKAPSELTLEVIDAPMISAFLDHLETTRRISARSRNLRLTAVRSFFRYVSYEEPAHALQIQRILALPSKRYSKKLVPFLDRSEVDALLAAPDPQAWFGRRDHAVILLAVQTGLRLSELTSLRCGDVHLGTGAHIRCLGKGRRERCTPLTKQAVTVLKTWMQSSIQSSDDWLFPNARGGRLSSDAVQDLVAKYRIIAAKTCSSLRKKRVSPHVLRHTVAMDLLQAGVDRSVIALWLGHQSLETTQVYLNANLALKEQILAKSTPYRSQYHRFKPEDSLLAFLKSL
jgi:site-specific recombinase XerD